MTQSFTSQCHHSPPSAVHQYYRQSRYGRHTKTSIFSSTTVDDDKKIKEIGEKVRKKRVKEIKEELKSLGLRTDDVFDKEELVMRLAVALMKADTADASEKVSDESSSSSSSSSTASSPSATVTSQQSSSKRPNSPNEIVLPLHKVSMEGVRPVDAISDRLGSVKIDGCYTALRTITLTLPSSETFSVMVDTACSGLVLRPSTVQRLGLPVQGGGGTGPVSMTTAGGTASGMGLSQLERFRTEDGSEFGPLPVAVQDIGALPPTVDGIIGLSFLEGFFGVVLFDFDRGELVLRKRRRDGSDDDGDNDEVTKEQDRVLEKVSDVEMRRCRLGIYAVDVVLDGRGPVRMLVDTGATATYLNWNGIERDMNLSRNPPHPLVQQNRESLGAMGADNKALSLTHRFVCQRRFQLEESGGGIRNQFLTGIDLTVNRSDGGDGGDGGVDIDIGDLPVLEQLQSDGVNGILGADLLMRCDVLRLSFAQSSACRIALYQKVE